MKSFNQIIKESKKKYDQESISPEEVDSFINQLKKSLPVDVTKASYLAKQYGLDSEEKLDKIRTSKKPQLKNLVDELNTPLNILEDLWQLFKDMKDNYKMMPQYINPSERELIMNNKMYVKDVLLDVESNKGKENIIKKYTPLIQKIANKYSGTSKLNRTDLISAGTEGLLNAIDNYSKDPNPETGKVSSFGAIAQKYILGAVLNEINKNGYSLTGSWYTAANGGPARSVSIDSLVGKDGEINPDRLPELGVEDAEKRYLDDDKSQGVFKKLYSALERKFSQRDIDIFYKYWGINGNDKEKTIDLAKKYNLSKTTIKNGPINKIINFIKSNPTLMDMLQELRDIYTEGLLCKCLGMNKDQIYEYLISDEDYILLEYVNRWSNKREFVVNLNYALERSKCPEIQKILAGGFKDIDDNVKKLRPELLTFLSYMFPAEQVNVFNDVDVIEYMTEVQTYYHKHIK